MQMPTALASIGQGLTPGIDYRGSDSGGNVAPKNSPEAVSHSGPENTPAPINGAIAANPEPGVAAADQDVIAAADFASNLGSRFSRLVASLTGRSTEAEVSADPIAIVNDGDPMKSATVEQASLGSPLIFGAATVMAFQYYPPLRRWIVRTKVKGATGRATIAAGFRGPHRRS